MVVNITLKFASTGIKSEAFPFPSVFSRGPVVGRGSAARLFLDPEKSSGSGADKYTAAFNAFCNAIVSLTVQN